MSEPEKRGQLVVALGFWMSQLEEGFMAETLVNYKSSDGPQDFEGRKANAIKCIRSQHARMLEHVKTHPDTIAEFIEAGIDIDEYFDAIGPKIDKVINQIEARTAEAIEVLS